LYNPNGAYFHLGTRVDISGTSALTGAGGVVVSALDTTSSTVMRLLNSTANTFTGGLFINGIAVVQFATDNQLGATGGAITLGGGTLVYGGTGGTSLDGSRSIRAGAAGGTIAINSTGSGTLTVPNTISGPGQMQFGGAPLSNSTAIVALTNPSANTYAGGTVVGTGVLQITNPNQLGIGAVYLNGGTLQAGGPLTLASAPVMAASSTINTNGNTLALSGGLNGSGGTAGTDALAMTLTKAGAGTLSITAWTIRRWLSLTGWLTPA
jgi:hypothetical protein